MTDGNAVPTGPPMTRYRRRGVTRLVLPGVDDSSMRMDGSVIADLTPILTEQLDEHANIRELELLSVSGHNQQEHLLCAKLHSSSPTETRQAGLRRFSETTKSSQRRSATDSVAEAAVRHLPEKIGVETADVDLSPLGLAPLRTGRLVLEENHEPVGENLAYHPVNRVVQQLSAASVPHVLQLLVRDGPGAKYNVSVRVVVMDIPAMSPMLTSFEELMTDGVKYDPADLFGGIGLTSNFRIPVKDYYKKWYDSYHINPANYKDRSDSLQARELFEGCSEYEELLRGRSGYDPLYQDLVGYPRFPANEVQLRQFAALSPLYYAESPWDAVGGRDPPTIATSEVLRSAPGTEHGLGTDTTPLPDAYHHESASSGSEGHEARLQLILQYHEEQGFEVVRVDQDGSSVPDGIAHLDDITVALEASKKSISKPAKPVVNAVRAAEDGRPVIFAAKDETQAKKLSDALKQPYDERVDDGVVLNTLTGGVTLDDGATVLLPSQDDQAAWTLTGDGQLQVTTRAGNDVFARGDAETAVNEYEYDAPRYIVKNGTHTVLSANGTEIETYQTKKAMLREWTQLQPPFVPTQLHYLGGVKIMYQAGDTLDRFEMKPKWTGVGKGKRETYEGAMAEFLRVYTQEEHGAELKKSKLYEAYDDWYDAMRDDDPLPTEKDGFTVKKHEIGRALPEEVDTKRREIDGSYEELIKDRRFAFPPSLHSPDVPVFADDDENSVE